jgi:hypothetical protein
MPQSVPRAYRGGQPGHKESVPGGVRSVFGLFSPDEETFANALLWKSLLGRTCTTLLWEGERAGKRVAVWGGRT